MRKHSYRLTDTRVLWSRGFAIGRREFRVNLEFKLQDLWVGAYWDANYTGVHVWVCLLPCLPLHVQQLVKNREV